MKKTSQIIIKIAIMLFLLQPVLITQSQAGFWSDVIKKGNEFIDESEAAANKQNKKTLNEDEIKQDVNQFYNMIFMIGVVITVLVGAVLGIKFMMGSLEEQAKIKQMLIAYVIGCIVIFGAFGIWRTTVSLLNGMSK